MGNFISFKIDSLVYVSDQIRKIYCSYCPLCWLADRPHPDKIKIDRGDKKTESIRSTTQKIVCKDVDSFCYINKPFNQMEIGSLCIALSLKKTI